MTNRRKELVAHTVKQDPDTGAVAVQGGDNRWGVMHPINGGHWATDDEVKDWAELKADS